MTVECTIGSLGGTTDSALEWKIFLIKTGLQHMCNHLTALLAHIVTFVALVALVGHPTMGRVKHS